MRASRKPPGDYEVGYGKPPVSGQFKPGQSGNPKGRPKGALNLSTSFRAALEERVTVTLNGRRTTRSKFQLMLVSAANQAVKGNLRATLALAQLAMQLGIGADEPQVTLGAVGTEDDAIILRALADLQPTTHNARESVNE